MFEDIYHQLNLFKKINTMLDTKGKYCDIPEGDPDIERFLASLPAFRVAESQTLKKKKLAINYNRYNRNNYFHNSERLKLAMIIHQLMDDGFEVYFNSEDQTVLATDYTLGGCLAKHFGSYPTSNEKLHQLLISDLQVTYDDIAVLDNNSFDELWVKFQNQPLTIWQSDFVGLDIDVAPTVATIKESKTNLRFIKNMTRSWADISKYDPIERINYACIGDPLTEADLLTIEEMDFIEEENDFSLRALLPQAPNLRKIKSCYNSPDVTKLTPLSVREWEVILNGLLASSLTLTVDENLIRLIKERKPSKKPTILSLTITQHVTVDELVTILKIFPEVTRILLEETELDFSNVKVDAKYVQAILAGTPTIKKIILGEATDEHQVIVIDEIIPNSHVDYIDFGAFPVSGKSWKNLLENNGLSFRYNHSLLELDGIDLNSENLIKILSNSPNAKALNITDCSQLLKLKSEQLSKLEKLNFCGDCTSEQMIALLKHIPNIKKLTFKSSQPLSPALIALMQSLEIEELDIANTPTISQTALLNILEKMSHLKQIQHPLQEINLKSANISSDTRKMILWGGRNTLKALALKSIDDFDALLSAGCQFKDLSLIALGNIELTAERLITIFNIARWLSLIHCRNHSLDFTGHQVDKFLLERLKTCRLSGIQEIDLGDNDTSTEVSVDDLIDIIAKNPGLKKLRYSLPKKLNLGFRVVTSRLLKILLEGNTSIKVLEAVAMKEIASRGYELNDVSFNDLEHIILQSSIISANFLISLLNCSPNLKIMDLWKAKIDFKDHTERLSLLTILKSYKNLHIEPKTFISNLEMETKFFSFAPSGAPLYQPPTSKIYFAPGVRSAVKGTQWVSADTHPEERTFNLKRIFLSTQSNGKHPSPSKYRLHCHDKIAMNDSLCDASRAFELKNGADLNLKPVNNIAVLKNDVFCEAKHYHDPESKGEIFYAKTTLLLTDQWVALPSLSPRETLRAFHTDPLVDLDIQYSTRDNLYYVRKKAGEDRDISIDYLVDVPPSPPPDNAFSLAINKLVQYGDFDVGELDEPTATSPNGRDFLLALALQRRGACSQRSIVFKALLEDKALRTLMATHSDYQELPALLKSLDELDQFGPLHCRIVTNDCHAYVEVLNNQGIIVECDLGGYPGKLNISELPHPANNSSQKNSTTAMISRFSSTQESALENKMPAGSAETIETIETIEIKDDAPPLKKPSPHSLPTTLREYFPVKKERKNVNAPTYLQETLSREESKRLIECPSQAVAGLCYHLQKHSQATGLAYYFVNSPEELLMLRPYIEYQANGSGMIRKKNFCGPLHRFLTVPADKRVIIVNFTDFSASDNALLDKQPSIDGFPLPPGTQVIGVVPTKEHKDASLYSRFGTAVEKCPLNVDQLLLPNPLIEETASEAKALIDLRGAANWKAKLIGTWSPQADGLTYKKGALVCALEAKELPSEIIIDNPPNDSEFTRFLREADLRGYFTYEGIKVDWPKSGLKLRHKVTFAKEQITNIQYGSPVDTQEIINQGNFQQFFSRYVLNEEKLLIESPGIIHEEKSTLRLYVSESLSVHQWSQLLAACQDAKVTLDSRLAPSVKLPDDLAFDLPKMPSSLSEQPFQIEHLPEKDCCICSTDIDVTLEQWQQKKNSLCIDVSDLMSSDLLVKITGEFAEECVAIEFMQENGALITALNQAKTVLLRGDFSPEMCRRLQAFIFKRSKDPAAKGQLAILTTAKTQPYFSELTPYYTHEVTRHEKQTELERYKKSLALESKCEVDQTASYVEQKAFLRHEKASSDQASPWAGMTAPLPTHPIEEHFDLTTVAQQTAAFNQERLTAVSRVLEHSPFVFLAGMTGVGKTTFVETIWKNAAEGRTLFVGKDQLSAWAQDRTPGIKAIFIDEANITANNWSCFEGLFNNHPPGLLIGNKYVALTNQHKVIFAGNPTSYSEDRQLPSLFKRHGNSVVFKPLTPAYIYHELLQPLFGGQDPALAEAIARPLLALHQYFTQLSRTEMLITPRELVMIAQLALAYCKQHPACDPSLAASYYAYQLTHQWVPTDKLTAFDKQFKTLRPDPQAIPLPHDAKLTITETNASSLDMLLDFLKFRQSLIDTQSDLPPGLGGILLEGMPGLGKSELSIACLRACHLTKRAIDDHSPVPRDPNYFYHLPASADPKVKEELLIRAFHEGAVVVYDEVNAAASLEVLLNRLLMGKGPRGEKPNKPGFMLIATQNPTTMAGRSKIGTALLHRLLYRQINHYTEPEMLAILHNLGLPERRAHALVAEYLKKSSKDPSLCFRDVITRAEEDLIALSREDKHEAQCALPPAIQPKPAQIELTESPLQTAPIVVDDFAKAIQLLEPVHNASHLSEAIDNLKTKMDRHPLHPDKMGAEVLHLVEQLVDPKCTLKMKRTAISTFENNTHPMSRGKRWLCRALATLVGAAVGFVIGLFAAGVGALPSAVIGGAMGFASGGLSFLGTRQRLKEVNAVGECARRFLKN